MINIDRCLKDERLMSATTGLTIKGFQKLVQTFGAAYREHQEQRYEEGLKNGTRKRQPGGGAKGRLTSMELKLFFILLYYKGYPTMDIMGLIFDLSRAKVKRHIDILTPILESSLGRKMVLPKRRISSLEEFYALIPEAKDLFTDGTERPIQRPKNSQKQRSHYSGKKKRHTKKNLVLSDEHKRVGYVSPTYEGKAHDYGIFKAEIDPSVIPKDIAHWLDKGFIGIEKDYPGVTVIIPKRKPKGLNLTDAEKEQNKIISGIRIVSEHAIGGIKRYRIVSDNFRNKTDKFCDTVMYLTCGLWNYRLEYC